MAARGMAGRLPGGRRLKAELDQCTRQRDLLREQVEAMRLRLQAQRPSPDVLRQVLPLRRAAFARAADPDAPRLEWLVPAGSHPRSPLEKIL